MRSEPPASRPRTGCAGSSKPATHYGRNAANRSTSGSEATSNRPAPSAAPMTTEGSDRMRPRLHFTADQGWISDPHGLTFHAGQYHLFHQYVPGSMNWAPN